MAIVPKALDVSGFSAALVDQDKLNVAFAAQAGSLPGIAQVSDDVPHFRIESRGAGVEAAQTVLNLTANGVTFPTGTLRTVRVRSYIKGNTNAKTAYLETVCVVIGDNTTPVINSNAQPIAINGTFTTNPPLQTIAVVSNAVVVQIQIQGADVTNMIHEVKVGKLQFILSGV